MQSKFYWSTTGINSLLSQYLQFYYTSFTGPHQLFVAYSMEKSGEACDNLSHEWRQGIEKGSKHAVQSWLIKHSTINCTETNGCHTLAVSSKSTILERTKSGMETRKGVGNRVGGFVYMTISMKFSSQKVVLKAANQLIYLCSEIPCQMQSQYVYSMCERVNNSTPCLLFMIVAALSLMKWDNICLLLWFVGNFLCTWEHQLWTTLKIPTFLSRLQQSWTQGWGWSTSRAWTSTEKCHGY